MVIHVYNSSILLTGIITSDESLRSDKNYFATDGTIQEIPDTVEGVTFEDALDGSVGVADASSFATTISDNEKILSTALESIQNSVGLNSVLENTEEFTNTFGNISLSEAIIKTSEDIPTNYVKTVNSIDPDTDGNVEIYVPYIKVEDSGSVLYKINPNTFYDFTGTITDLTITFGEGVDSALNEYMFLIYSNDPATLIILPANIKFIGDSTVLSNKVYQFSIVNNVAVIGGTN